MYRRTKCHFVHYITQYKKKSRQKAAASIRTLQHGTKSGQLFWKTGAVFASSDCIEIHIHGKGGHASTPFLAINPILIAAEIINSLQGLVSRESTYNVPAVLTVTGITAGNGAYNIIPNSATIVGGLRTQSLEVRSHLLKRMEEISKQCAAMYGATAEMKVPSGCPPVINDPTMTADFITAAKKSSRQRISWNWTILPWVERTLPTSLQKCLAVMRFCIIPFLLMMERNIHTIMAVSALTTPFCILPALCLHRQ